MIGSNRPVRVRGIHVVRASWRAMRRRCAASGRLRTLPPAASRLGAMGRGPRNDPRPTSEPHPQTSGRLDGRRPQQPLRTRYRAWPDSQDSSPDPSHSPTPREGSDRLLPAAHRPTNTTSPAVVGTRSVWPAATYLRTPPLGTRRQRWPDERSAQSALRRSPSACPPRETRYPGNV